jgi:ankyrin repeat protein
MHARLSLEQQKKRAKELIRAVRDGNADAVARIRAVLPDKSTLSLADAQFVLAREHGFANWREFTRHVERIDAESLPPVERFKQAVRRLDPEALRRVLRDHAEARAAINQPLFGFDSPALVAVSGDSLEMVDVLLELGADPNRKSDWWAGGFHPLHGAGRDVAERLLAAGAVADACAAAHLDRADWLARMLADDPARVHERGGDGKTPLHFARSRALVDLLLAAGADPDARDVDHRASAAQWMLGDQPDHARHDLAAYLVERGATADIFLVAALGLADRARAMLQRDPGLLALRTGQGEYGEKPPGSYHIYLWTIGPNQTPLQTAAKFGREETLRVMEGFASPGQRLLLACHRGEHDAARAIVAAHPGIVERLEGADRRALTDEAWAANAPAVRLMLSLGFDPSVPSVSGPTGGTALHCAAWEGSVECVTALLDHPAGQSLVATRDPTWHGTPLGWCGHGSLHCGNPAADHATVARRLIAAGTPIDPGMDDGAGSDAVQAIIDEALRTRR